MPSDEEEERAVFEDEDEDEDDDDEDTEGDDTEEEDDAGDDASPAAARPPLPPPKAENPDASTILSSANPTTNPNPNPNTPSDPSSMPQNGAISVVLLASAATSISVPVASVSEERKPVAPSLDESRRLFQRLWTDEDEIIILRGFLDFTTRRGTTFASHQYDTGPFYEEIKKQLQLEFTKNQLIEKLRRLKKKYRNCVNRIRSMGKDFSFKSPHEQTIFEIARNIWKPSIKRDRDSDEDELNPPNNGGDSNYALVVSDGALSSDRKIYRPRRRFRRRTVGDSSAAAAAAAVAAAGDGTAVPVVVTVDNSIPTARTPSSSSPAIPVVIEETVRSCLTPLFKELVNSSIGAGPLASVLVGGGGQLGLGSLAGSLNALPLSLGGNSGNTPEGPVNDKWKKQQILELEVYLKRIELVRDQIKSTLQELKSSAS